MSNRRVSKKIANTLLTDSMKRAQTADNILSAEWAKQEHFVKASPQTQELGGVECCGERIRRGVQQRGKVRLIFSATKVRNFEEKYNRE